MMQKHAQPMSPRTQAFAQGAPSGEEETKLFEDGLSQMAYNVLVSKFPDLIQNVVTFKILDTDIESGAGAGAFVVQHDNETLYIPVVMADNQIKPLDMFYHKGLNVFLPLNNDWLDEVSQLTLDETGEAIEAPKSLRRNVDTRNIMIPPTTGRYAYAARNEPLTDDVITADVYRMLERMTKTAAEQPAPMLIKFLTFAPDTIKEAFYNVLKSRPKLAANVATLYGLEAVARALEMTKTASATSPKGGALFVADKDTPATKFKEVFGDKAPEAYQGVLLKGYQAKDNRTNTNSAVQIQGEEKLKTPSDSGFYRIFTSDGKEQSAFILHNPREITQSFNDGPERRHGKRRDTLEFGQHNKTFIVITRGGAWQRTNKLVAEPLDEQKDGPTALFNAMSNERGGQQPRVGDRGLFIVQKGQTWVGTEPFRIKSIASREGIKRITLQDWENTVLVMDKNAAKVGLHQPKGEPIVYIPYTARFIRLKDDPMHTSELLSTPSEVHRWFHDKFDAMGANSASVKNAGAGQFSLNGTQERYNKVGAMKTAALQFNIPFTEAEALVKEAAGRPNGRTVAYILTPLMLQKMAQVPMMGDPATAGGAPPPGGAPMDPSMDPAMQGAAPPPPAPPSPLDIAMGEAQTQIQQQDSDLQQQSVALQDKAQTLMMVQQRAQEIATGGPEAVQQGAPPMPPPGAGAPQGAPPPGGAAPQGAAPPQGGAMPSPAPEATGGGMAAAGMSPGMEGGMPPTGATMNTESPSAMEIQQQVNPQFLEGAAGMNDTGTFDAAAIASMAQSPSFRDMVVDYVPTLERALDNLGRVLLTMWMQEGDLKKQLGDEDYTDTEDNLRVVFEGLGKLILQMNRNAIVVDEDAQPGM